MTEQDIAGKNATFINFQVSAELYATVDKVVTY